MVKRAEHRGKQTHLPLRSCLWNTGEQRQAEGWGAGVKGPLHGFEVQHRRYFIKYVKKWGQRESRLQSNGADFLVCMIIGFSVSQGAQHGKINYSDFPKLPREAPGANGRRVPAGLRCCLSLSSNIINSDGVNI